MKRESFIYLLEVYSVIQFGIKDTLELFLGNAITVVGYEEGFLGKLTKIEKIIKNECHPDFLKSDEDGCSFYSLILENVKLSSEEKADILMNPRKTY